jgi:hypothetical protein
MAPSRVLGREDLQAVHSHTPFGRGVVHEAEQGPTGLLQDSGELPPQVSAAEEQDALAAIKGSVEGCALSASRFGRSLR